MQVNFLNLCHFHEIFINKGARAKKKHVIWIFLNVIFLYNFYMQLEKEREKEEEVLQTPFEKMLAERAKRLEQVPHKQDFTRIRIRSSFRRVWSESRVSWLLDPDQTLEYNDATLTLNHFSIDIKVDIIELLIL